MFRRREVASRDAGFLGWVARPDRWARQIASLGMATNTFSPASAGVHGASTQPRGFTGDRGYGVNRFGGALDYAAGSVQDLTAPVHPLRSPVSDRVGLGAGVSGQPGYPSTGQDAGGLASLAWLGYGQLNNRTGLGG